MPAPSSARRAAVVLASVLVLAVAVLAGCATVVSGRGSPAITPSGSSGSTGGSSPAPSSSPTVQERPAACPVTDRRAGLKFSCLQDGMLSVTVNLYSTQLVFQTESSPDWYMSQVAVLANDKGGLKFAAGLQLSQFVAGSFPEGSKGLGLSDHLTKVGGHQAYYVDGRVTIKKTGEDTKLKAVKDRVVLLAVDRGNGVASVLILDVPDTNQSLWPLMDKILATVTLV